MELVEGIKKVRMLQNVYDRLVNVLRLLEGKKEYPLGRSGVFSTPDIETCRDYIQRTTLDIQSILTKIKTSL